VPPHGIEAIRFTPPGGLVFECEEFLELNNLKPIVAPSASREPGSLASYFRRARNLNERTD